MIPQETVMNWSTERPKFEEVKGKRCYVAWIAQDGRTYQDVVEPNNKPTYDIYFDDDFLRYAIISEPLEAKELWGSLPQFHNKAGVGKWEAIYVFNGITIMRYWFDTEAEAITAWNDLVDKIEGER